MPECSSGRCGPGGKTSRLAVGGLPVRSHPGRVEVSMSKTPNPQLLLTSWLVPCMAANHRWRVNVCVNGWMKGIHCTALWIKALYKFSPFTILYQSFWSRDSTLQVNSKVAFLVTLSEKTYICPFVLRLWSLFWTVGGKVWVSTLTGRSTCVLSHVNKRRFCCRKRCVQQILSGSNTCLTRENWENGLFGPLGQPSIGQQ